LKTELPGKIGKNHPVFIRLVFNTQSLPKGTFLERFLFLLQASRKYYIRFKLGSPAKIFT
jgi:hypothetical protein